MGHETMQKHGACQSQHLRIVQLHLFTESASGPVWTSSCDVRPFVCVFFVYLLLFSHTMLYLINYLFIQEPG